MRSGFTHGPTLHDTDMRGAAPICGEGRYRGSRLTVVISKMQKGSALAGTGRLRRAGALKRSVGSRRYEAMLCPVSHDRPFLCRQGVTVNDQ